ncbi:MAG: rhodanese-like domain-containing protein [Anaerolineales bacterium]|nr:rhodanese-like domain-containing protein [Anaerolineales bacterium]
MKTISAEELKAKLDRGDEFHLVMTMGAWAYEMAHIPGSQNVDNIEYALANIDRDEEIIVYCSNILCIASISAYKLLVANGYTNVRRFAGGVEAWQKAGYPLEGTSA